MLEAVHAQKSKKASREKAKSIVVELKAMKLPEVTKKMEEGGEGTLTYRDFSSEHWTRIRTNNVIERLNREIRPCPARHVARHPVGQQKVYEHEALGALLDDASSAG